MGSKVRLISMLISLFILLTGFDSTRKLSENIVVSSLRCNHNERFCNYALNSDNLLTLQL